MLIGFATRDWGLDFVDAKGVPGLGGSGHARVGMPARALAHRGHTVHTGTLIEDRENWQLGVRTFGSNTEPARALGGFDVIVLQRWMFGGSIGELHLNLANDIRKARANGQVIVNDVDDHFWKIDSRNRAAKTLDSNTLENRRHYLDILKASTLVTCSTPFLRDELHELGVTNTVVIRNAIDLWRWETHDVTRDPATIGWVGVVGYRSGDLEVLRPLMARFLRAHPELHFHHSGTHQDTDDPVSRLLGLSTEQAAQLTTQPMKPISSYPEQWLPLDFTVIPLSEQPFNFAKSCIKGMEAAAAGVPFVATPTPEYRWLAKQGIGRLAPKRAAWERELHALCDPHEREQQAKENRAALEPLDIAARVIEWEQCYESLT